MFLRIYRSENIDMTNLKAFEAKSYIGKSEHKQYWFNYVKKKYIKINGVEMVDNRPSLD